jgi:hypothetical protein
VTDAAHVIAYKHTAKAFKDKENRVDLAMGAKAVAELQSNESTRNFMAMCRIQIQNPKICETLPFVADVEVTHVTMNAWQMPGHPKVRSVSTVRVAVGCNFSCRSKLKQLTLQFRKWER